MTRFSLLFLLLIAACSACRTTDLARPASGLTLEDELDAEQLIADLRFLASDELRGREAGSSDIDVAARYLAEQFRAAGAEPAPGAANYMQPVTLLQIAQAEQGMVALGGDTLLMMQDMIVLSGKESDLTAPVAFLDYGISAPSEGIDDFAGKDISGHIAVVRYGAPPDRLEIASAARSSAKLKRAFEAGAVALVELYGGNYGQTPIAWPRIASYFAGPRTGLGDPSLSMLHVMLDDSEGHLARSLAGGRDQTMTISTSGRPTVERECQNVAAIIPGSDPSLRDEFVLLTAHYDHVGVDAGAVAPADSIHNGARDNGMGTVGLIGAARALAADPPARSVLLLALTAEEAGLLGARYYVQNPLVPLNRSVFVLNNDGAGFTDTSIVTIIGLTRTSAESAIVRGAERYGLSVIDDPVPEQMLFDRSDNVEFAQVGIPAPTFSPGFRAFDAELLRYYHQPADEVDEAFDLDYFVRFVKAYAHTARLIADAPEAPTWTPGDPYEAAYRSLQATD